MKQFKVLWAAHPLRALGEAWLIGLLLMGTLSRLVEYVSPFVLSNGILFLCGACGLWTVLRTRLPQGDKVRQAGWELLVGFLLSLVQAAGVQGLASLLGWQAIWTQSSFSSGIATLLFVGTGPGYVATRLAVRLLLLWNRMRQQRMLWALTHAHLTLVLLIAAIFALVFFIAVPFSRGETLPQAEASNWPANVAAEVLTFLFPAFSLIVVLTVFALLVLLPPSALFSFLVARRTTQRLEELAAAADAFQQGDYEKRVTVKGKDEVAQLQSAFNTMAGELQETLGDLEAQRDTVAQLLQSRRELVASVSHELRTPVATVRATLESALSRPEEPLPPLLQHDLEVMEGEVLRLQRLITDLFTLSRTDVGQLPLTCQPTDIAPLVQRIVEALAPLAWNAGRVEVIADLPEDLPQARVDHARLEQVLANLVRNGIRHTPPGGIVAMVAAAEESAVRIEVRDTGEGIAPEDLPHIWERFYRGESSRDRDSGSAGLGLALVKELTEAMGGTVEVESTVGQGSCFSLRFPRA